MDLGAAGDETLAHDRQSRRSLTTDKAVVITSPAPTPPARPMRSPPRPLRRASFPPKARPRSTRGLTAGSTCGSTPEPTTRAAPRGDHRRHDYLPITYINAVFVFRRPPPGPRAASWTCGACVAPLLVVFLRRQRLPTGTRSRPPATTSWCSARLCLRSDVTLGDPGREWQRTSAREGSHGLAFARVGRLAGSLLDRRGFLRSGWRSSWPRYTTAPRPSAIRSFERRAPHRCGGVAGGARGDGAACRSLARRLAVVQLRARRRPGRRAGARLAVPAGAAA